MMMSVKSTNLEDYNGEREDNCGILKDCCPAGYKPSTSATGQWRVPLTTPSIRYRSSATEERYPVSPCSLIGKYDN